MSRGDMVGRAWAAVEERLPEGWVVTGVRLMSDGQLVMPDGEIRRDRNVWSAQARPGNDYAWRNLKRHNINPHSCRGTGRSPVEALLSLALKAEEIAAGKHPDAVRLPTVDAVDALFKALFKVQR